MGGDTEQNSGSSTAEGLSASSTMRRPRRRAASQIGRTNKGYQLSANTTSAAAARPSGLDVATAVTRSSR